jgi:uncharacterized repeat protein (TIGR03803 family)
MKKPSGTTPPGGADERGAVFSLSPAGQLTTLYSFTTESDGQWPFGGLVEGKDGYFYGTTSYGGTGFDGLQSGGQGTVFRVSPRGDLSTLAYFVGANGAAPGSHNAALMQAADGGFFGTTLYGGANGYGTVFRLTVPSISLPPQLTITPAGPNLELSWPTNAIGFVLQDAVVIGPSTNWVATPIPFPPIILNGQFVVTIPRPPTTRHFYRLSQ